MGSKQSSAAQLAAAVTEVLGVAQLPVRLRLWDGSEAGPPGAPVIRVRSPRAVRRLMWAPGELGLGRAYVAGELDLEDDVFATLAALTSSGRVGSAEPTTPLGVRARLRLAATAARLGALGPDPAPPPEEVRLRRFGRRHSRARDAAAISHHYDVGNDFYALVLGASLVYSCAVWDSPATGLDAAQEAKLDLVCRKLDLRPGARLLDVGCGWGSLAMHAADRYGAQVVGITLSREQAGLARRRVAEAGLADRVQIRVQDYRTVDDGPFDAVASIGMAEHVGRANVPRYATRLHDLLRPGGRLLHHAIAWNAGAFQADPDTFIARFVFPDGELLGLADIVGALEATGLEALDVEALRLHYALTLRAWVDRLEKNWDAAVAANGLGRARVWRLYMAGSALAFETGRMGVNQVLLQRPGGDPPPLRLRDWR
ncbi:SAM-dependent methyltransferase [Geodermatophilus ruber]|uniref:Cyclopropane-fatty-acyl-phospholipid synthase n=1 Tax=Geodermatophilus ruber TaxID=504800 RepID=A0A1I4D0N9_9ACTN|nr:cyclopropane-fatty-acyl-phospholipid synthase family protein [Geodermatophilus ruber]SFK87194.1 cyclopropane-fatty-acyl-phospholipid synthase [Geodermatophilus ruber]